LEELNTALTQVDKSLKALRNNLSAAMRIPATHDAVYETATDIFSRQSEFNLTREKPERLRIRHLARKRFVLGYPPRKHQDTSIGDALNWEWIIECAKKSQRSVIIVSRDSDYGLTFEDESYLNEWLRHEFSERVGGKHQVSLTQSLSTALKQIKVRVTKAEEESEEKLIKATEPRPIDYLKAITAADLEKALQYSNDFNEMLRRLSEPEKKMRELNDAGQRVLEALGIGVSLSPQ
jgi:PIN domain